MDERKEQAEQVKDNERVVFLFKGKQTLFRMLFSRMGIVLLLLLVQIALILSGFLWLKDLAPYLWSVNSILGLAIVLNIINSEDNPVVKLTWSVLIMLIPAFGLLFYLVVKGDFGQRFMVKRYQQILSDSNPTEPQSPELLKAMEEEPGDLASTSKYLHQLGFPTYTNTSVRYFPLGEQKFEEMLRQLEAAEKFIFMEYFIIEEGYMWGRILDVLERKVQQGVEVRVMYDGTCAFNLLPYNYPKKLAKLGIQCKMFSPVRPLVSTHYNNRDHRKILVIDGKVAFTGGVNLADEYINRKVIHGHWKDTAVMLQGEAAQSFTRMFLQMWNISQPMEDFAPYITCAEPHEAEGYVIPYGDNPFDNELVGEMVYINILNQAKRYVHIMTPYLILDNELITALTFAAKRGVEVKLILPHIPDMEVPFALAHGHYAQLMVNGVQVYEYTPGFVHAKVFVSDDNKAVVGSINLDYRSLYHHFECATYLHQVPAIAEIEQDIQHTLKSCQLMTPELLKKDPWLRKATGTVLKLFGPLM